MSKFKKKMEKWEAEGFREGFSPYLFSPNPHKNTNINPFSEYFDGPLFAVMMGLSEEEYARRYPISYTNYG